MFIYKTEFVTHTTSHHVNRLHFPAMTFATVMEEVLLNCMTKFCRQRSFSVPGKKSRKWLYDYTTKMASGTRRVNNTLPLQAMSSVRQVTDARGVLGRIQTSLKTIERMICQNGNIQMALHLP